MIRFLLSVAVLGLAGGVLVNSAPSRTSAVCSLAPFPTARHAGTTVFIGRAADDTLFAGPGSVRYGVRGGHWSSNRDDRPVYGQRVIVERIAGAGADALSRSFSQRKDSSVVVVPWDYDPACKHTLWGRSFVWTPPDSVGVFTVSLRPHSQWAAQWPTFDAFAADMEPYPHGIFYQTGYLGTDAVPRGEALSVTHFFDFYLALPEYDPDRSHSLRYWETLCDWAAAHPREARLFPAAHVLQRARCS